MAILENICPIKQLFTTFMNSAVNVIFLIALLLNHNVEAQSPRSIILEMVESAAKLEGFTAEITKEERIAGKLVKQITAVKLIREPYQLYLNQRYPKEGVEILCRPDHDRALINPNSFPWFNLHLDPFGSFMRNDQHHTVYDSGFDLMSSILHRELARIGDDTARHIFYRGTVTWQNRPAIHIEMANPDYHHATYQVLLGEDLNSIAKKLNVNEYAILELNDDVDFYDDVMPGQKIQVPSSYAKKMELYIDSEFILPLVIRVYDSEGLYEHYAYKKFVLNPSFKAGEFTSDFEEYDF
jgi:outer membrane lipoprotein-sorting protein